MNRSELIALVHAKGPATTQELLPYTSISSESLSNRLTNLKNLGELTIVDRRRSGKGGKLAVWACADKPSSNLFCMPGNPRRDSQMKAYAANMAFKTTWVGGNPFEKETRDTHQPSSTE